MVGQLLCLSGLGPVCAPYWILLVLLFSCGLIAPIGSDFLDSTLLAEDPQPTIVVFPSGCNYLVPVLCPKHSLKVVFSSYIFVFSNWCSDCDPSISDKDALLWSPYWHSSHRFPGINLLFQFMWTVTTTSPVQWERKFKGPMVEEAYWRCCSSRFRDSRSRK